MKVEEKVVLLIALVTLLAMLVIAGPKAAENLGIVLKGYGERNLNGIQP